MTTAFEGLRRPNWIWLVILIAAALAVVAAITATRAETITSRFRLDIDLSVDGAIGHGTGVWEVQMREALSYSGPRIYHETRVMGEAIEVPLSDGKIALVLRRGVVNPSNSGAGAIILDCLGDVPDMPAALRNFTGGCLSEQKLMVVIVGEGGLEALMRAKYAEEATTNDPVIDSISIHAEVTSASISASLSDRYPWILSLPTIYPEPGVYDAWASKLYKEDFTTVVMDK